MPKTPTIWLTRPQADSEALAAELLSHGITSIISPVMRIEAQPISLATNDAPHALLLTSRHAAAALADLPSAWRTLPVYCVGEATAAAARAQHYCHVIAGKSDILALLPLIVADLPTESRLLYLAGDETRVDVATLLAAQQIYVETCVAYHSVAEHELSATLRTALVAGDVAAAAFFSPRSAALGCDLLIASNLAETAHRSEAYCLSLNAVEAAARLRWRALHACHRPTRGAMLQLIVSELKKTL